MKVKKSSHIFFHVTYAITRTTHKHTHSLTHTHTSGTSPYSIALWCYEEGISKLLRVKTMYDKFERISCLSFLISFLLSPKIIVCCLLYTVSFLLNTNYMHNINYYRGSINYSICNDKWLIH